VRVVPQAHIVRVSDGQSHVDLPLRLFNVTKPYSLLKFHGIHQGYDRSSSASAICEFSCLPAQVAMMMSTISLSSSSAL
jgi:hypothetical protein